MELFYSGICTYVAFAVFLSGGVLRIASWLGKPVPFHLTLFPAPAGRTATLSAVGRELFFFPGLFRENRALWFAVWPFHFSLALILAGHILGISCLRGQFCLFGATEQTSILLSKILGSVAGIILVGSLCALALRRLADPDLRRLTPALAWFDLLLLLAIVLSGFGMYLPSFHADLPAVRAYIGGLLTLRPGPFPSNPLFAIHLTLVNLLLLYFPFSQLMHAAGFFVNRAMLAEAPPHFPTPPGARNRSRFAEPDAQSGLHVSCGDHVKREEFFE